MKSRNILLLSLLLMAAVALKAEGKVTSLKTDYKTNPLGIDNPVPRFSWVLESDQENTMQVSYEIKAAASEKELKRGRKLLWDTEQVATSQSIHVAYGGEALRSFQRIYWKVRVKDNHGNTSKWSEVAWWETGFMQGSEWEAEWIGPSWEEEVKQSNPSPYLRKAFDIDGIVSDARLYITAQGLYQVEINGKRIGDQEFTPGWTSYDTRLQYQTYDVTEHIRNEQNALGIVLGDGWFRGNLGWKEGGNIWGSEVAALAELHIIYQGGERQVISTDGSWKASKGPILESDIYNGEVYDATRELTGWSTSDYNDSDWQPVKVAEISKSTLIATEGPPVKVIDVLEPLSIQKVGEEWIVDMGQNMVGWIQIKASGSKGDKLTLKHAEVLDKFGNMYYDNLRRAKCTNTYVLKGGAEETFEPHFTFQGFRFVSVSGYPGTLTADHIRGMVIHSAMEPSGTFTCSDPMINHL